MHQCWAQSPDSVMHLWHYRRRTESAGRWQWESEEQEKCDISITACRCFTEPIRSTPQHEKLKFYKCLHLSTYKKLSWCWQTRATHLEVSQGHHICAIVTLSVKCSVFEIFDFKNAVILKNGFRRGHWKYHHSIERDSVVTFYSNYVPIACRFWYTQCRKISRPWLKSRSRVNQSHWKVVPFDRLYIPISVL